MEVFTLTPQAKPKVMVLLPQNVCNKGSANFLLQKIVVPLGMDIKDFAFAGGFVPEKGKLKKADFDTELVALKEYCEMYSINIIAVGNADYYQNLTGDKKMMLNIGRVVEGHKDMVNYQIVPILNPVILNMFPERFKELNRGLSVIKNLLLGDYTDPVETLDLDMNLILKDPTEVYNHLKAWIDEPELYVDIETTGLRWYADKMLTISFARNEKEAFCVALHPKYHSEDTYRKLAKTLKAFFSQYKGKLVGHNWIGFDQAFITHEIMRGSDFGIRQEPLINLFNLEDSMLLVYVLFNSTERPSLGLKELVFSFMGEYDSDIDQKNLFGADLYKVATYNNYDVIATCRIWKQYREEVSKDENKSLIPVYEEIRDIGVTLLKMKMNGLRIKKDKVSGAIEELNELVADKLVTFRDHPIIRQAEDFLAKRRFKKYNDGLKNKKKWADVKDEFLEPFNPGSPNQKQFLFFELMNLPVIKISKTSKKPSTDKDVIAEWLELDITKEQEELLNLLRDIMDADKVNSTYLKVFKESSVEVKPGHWKVFANFNQTGTVSGRLSSSGGLNFQNMPSNSKYGELIKKLLIPDDGFVIGAVDYAALEDRLIAVEANDPMKLAVFTDGIDG
jgi:DNA polymerase-1